MKIQLLSSCTLLVVMTLALPGRASSPEQLPEVLPVERISSLDIQSVEIEARQIFEPTAHSAGFAGQVKEWAQKLNVSELLLRQSLYARKGGATGSDDIKNLVMLLGASHMIEMSFGPVGVGVSGRV